MGLVSPLRVLRWEQPANNDFLLVSQITVTGALYTCRPDLVGFVNGLPLVVIELKKPGVPARTAVDENLTHYKAEIPQLFWFNALLIASNGMDQPGRIAHGGLGAVLRVEAHRARGRAAPGDIVSSLTDPILLLQNDIIGIRLIRCFISSSRNLSGPDRRPETLPARTGCIITFSSSGFLASAGAQTPR